MKITFYSNYLTHHQIPFCEAMRSLPDIEFCFVSTMAMEQERKSGGWELDNTYDYELKAYLSDENHQKALRLAAESDVMLIGSAPEEYVAHRMKHHPFPLTLRYSERIYKRGRWRVLSPRGALLRLKTYFRYIQKPLYMLCASAYAAGDLAMLGSYLGRCFKWGYFPETKHYKNVNELIQKKEPRTVLWTARMIDWKHPEIPVEIARRLKLDGYDFRLNMIGIGPMKESIQEKLQKYDLQNSVHLLGTVTPDQVRKLMEKHSIFLLTSDQNEGWGAVINEAMNSGCAVIADQRIGSVPFLIEDGENGFVYNDFEDLYRQVTMLLDHPEIAGSAGSLAYATITEKWCALEAAKRLHNLCQHLLQGKKVYMTDGPCSKAQIFVKKRR